MIIGIRAHDLGRFDVEILSDKIKEKGFNTIQLALLKALSDPQYSDGCLSTGFARKIRNAFFRNNIETAVFGCYVNLMHPDDDTREALYCRFHEHILFAKDIGCSVVGTETGSVNADYSYNHENGSESSLELLAKRLEPLVDSAETAGVFLSLEGVVTHIVNTPLRMKKLLDMLKSDRVRVIFDPVNFLSFENYRHQKDIMQQSFDLFGEKIITIHAKDFKIENNERKTVVSLNGFLDYEFLFKLIKSNKPYIDVLLENSPPELMRTVADKMYELYETV